MGELTTTLTTTEANRLAHLERDIAQGMAQFVQVGLALAEINKARLYRNTHNTFESYLTERWGISRGHAYRLIGAAVVVAELSPMGDSDKVPATERQARELGKVAKEDREDVWKEAQAINDTDQPTAKQIKEVASKKTPTPADEVDERVDPADVYMAKWASMADRELPAEVANRVEWRALAMEWRRRAEERRSNKLNAKAIAVTLMSQTHPDDAPDLEHIYLLAKRLKEALT